MKFSINKLTSLQLNNDRLSYIILKNIIYFSKILEFSSLLYCIPGEDDLDLFILISAVVVMSEKESLLFPFVYYYYLKFSSSVCYVMLVSYD